MTSALATATLWSIAQRRAPLTSAQAASILLGPYLYPQYIKWQSNIDNSAEFRFYDSPQRYILIRNSVRESVIGNLPNPEHYKAFMSRIKTDLYTRHRQAENWEDQGQDAETDTPPVLIVADLCGHTVHPGNPIRSVDVCPMCIMQQCIAALKRIACVWVLLGGPRQRPADPFQLKLYLGVKKIWHVEKNRWANLIFRYHDFAAMERRWEEQGWSLGFETPEVVKRAESCMAALEVAGRAPLLAEGWDEEFVPLKKKGNARADGPEMLERETPGAVESPRLPPGSLGPLSEDPVRCEKQAPKNAQHTHEHPAWATKKREDILDLPPSPYSPRRSISPSQLSSEYIPSPPPPPSPSLPKRTQHKRVTFADDVILQPPPRPSSSFRRNSPTYRRGRHACPPGSVWQETSFMNDALFDIFGSGDDEDEEEGEEEEDEPERRIDIERARDVTYAGGMGEEEDEDEDSEFDLDDKDVEEAMMALDTEQPKKSNGDRLASSDSDPTPTSTYAPLAPRQDHGPRTADSEELEDVNVPNSSRRRSRDELESAEDQQAEESEAKRRCA